jgi:uncharacterized membrane protein YfcA
LPFPDPFFLIRFSQESMNIEYQLVLELALMGACAGFLAGLLGIGGGMIMVPFMAIILSARNFPPDYVLKTAVATSLASICFTSISSVWAHHQRGAVRWSLALKLAPGILLGSLIGSQIAVAMPSKILGLVFALFLAFSATQMFINRKPKATRTLPGWPGLFGMGNAIGGLSSLVGGGGAFISVPFMSWCNVKIHQAVATSAALGFPIALAGTLGYAWSGSQLPDMPPGSLGYVYLPGLLFIALASILTAPLGARTAHRMDILPLRRAFAIVLYLMAAYFLLR